MNRRNAVSSIVDKIVDNFSFIFRIVRFRFNTFFIVSQKSGAKVVQICESCKQKVQIVYIISVNIKMQYFVHISADHKLH